MLKIFQLESAAPGVLRAAEVREGEVPRGARADRELHHRQGHSGTAGGSQGETTRIIHCLNYLGREIFRRTRSGDVDTNMYGLVSGRFNQEHWRRN